jgi:Family of unknown function (DUF6069)
VFAWAMAVPIAGVRLAVHNSSGGQTEVQVAQVAIAGLLAGVAAWGLLAVLERYSRRARSVWTVIAATILALSLTGPLSATSAAAGITLACLHLLVGGTIIVGLRAVRRSGHGRRIRQHAAGPNWP